VPTEVLSTDQDSLFPLQAALGYDIAQNLFLGAQQHTRRGHLRFHVHHADQRPPARPKSGRISTRDGACSPTGGAQNIPAFVALLGGHLDVTVLIDSGTKGAQRLTFRWSTRPPPSDEVLPQLSTGTLDRFEKLIEQINKTLPAA
jgi:hypothetical protein